MNNIHYQNQEEFEKTLETLKSEGFEKLHILADFDRTLTKSFVNGEKTLSIIFVLRDEGYLSEIYRKKAHALFAHYHPIEIDPNISMEKKIKEMTVWWKKHLGLIIDYGLSKKDIEDILNSGNIQLRGGIRKFLGFLNEKSIPLVIISANELGNDVIGLFLEKEGFLTQNIHIISNTLFWDKNGQAIEFDKRIIHSLNKGKKVLSDYPEIYETVKTRKNVILLGDSLGDPDMIEGFDYDNLIKIGFLNEKEEGLLETYLEKYDVVLTGDDEGDFLASLFPSSS